MNLKLLNKKGFTSIYMILWMAVLIPFFLFIFMDLTYYVSEHIRLKSITDNAAASAVTQINEDLVKFGTLEIDNTKANEVAKEIIIRNLNLNDDFSPAETNKTMSQSPTIDIRVFNTFLESGYEYETPIGKVLLKKPSVVIYAEYPVEGLFFKKIVNVKKIGVSQVQFREENIDK